MPPSRPCSRGSAPDVLDAFGVAMDHGGSGPRRRTRCEYLLGPACRAGLARGGRRLRLRLSGHGHDWLMVSAQALAGRFVGGTGG